MEYQDQDACDSSYRSVAKSTAASNPKPGISGQLSVGEDICLIKLEKMPDSRQVLTKLCFCSILEYNVLSSEHLRCHKSNMVAVRYTSAKSLAIEYRDCSTKP